MQHDSHAPDCLCSPLAVSKNLSWSKECPLHGIDSDWVIESPDAAGIRQILGVLPWDKRMLEEGRHKYNIRHVMESFSGEEE